jgi:hypothetical protein
MLAVISVGNTDTLQPTQIQVIHFQTYIAFTYIYIKERGYKKIEMAVFKMHSIFFIAGMKAQLNKGGKIY